MISSFKNNIIRKANQKKKNDENYLYKEFHGLNQWS